MLHDVAFSSQLSLPIDCIWSLLISALVDKSFHAVVGSLGTVVASVTGTDQRHLGC